MYNYNFCIKKLKESKRKLKREVVEDSWLKNYHDNVQPLLLEHYDARVNAFIKRVEENPAKSSKIIENPHPNPFKPFRFALSGRSHTEHKLTSKNNLPEDDYNKGSIFRSSVYIPLNQHQFRERDKSKEIKVKSSKSQALYIKMKEQRKADSKLLQEKVKPTGFVTARNTHKESYSDANSFYDDNVSLRYSINSQIDNIQKEALEYEKKLEIVEKKSHFKRLANLEVLVNDPRAKKSIYDLLVKEGKRRAKIKTEREEGETDMLKYIIEKGLKTENI